MKLQPLNSSIASRLYEQPAGESWHSFEQQQQQEPGDGGGGAADAGGGGGGGAAVAEPPDGGGADPNADVFSFEAPDPEAVVAALTAKGTPKEPPAPGTKKQAAPPPPKPGDKPPAADPGKGEPIAQLRSSYETLKKEHAELKQKLEAGDPRLKALETERDAAKKELESAKARTTEYERELALANPAVVKELRDADEGYSKEADRFYRSVPEIDHPTVSGLVTAYSKLPFGKPEYAEALAKFEATVNQQLGGDENTTSRRLEKTLEWIEKSYDFSRARPGLVDKVRKDALKLKAEHETAKYGEGKTRVSGLIQKAMQVPEGMDKTDPHHPQVVLKRFDEQLTPEQVSAFDKGIPEFLELAINGAPPRTEADYAGLNPQQIAERQSTEAANIQKAKDHLIAVATVGMRWARRVPTLYAMLAKYKELAGKRADGAPPDPGSGESGDGGDDLKDFRPPEIPEGL